VERLRRTRLKLRHDRRKFEPERIGEKVRAGLPSCRTVFSFAAIVGEVCSAFEPATARNKRGTTRRCGAAEALVQIDGDFGNVGAVAYVKCVDEPGKRRPVGGVLSMKRS